VRNLKVNVNTLSVRETLRKNYEAYQKSWAETEAKWQEVAVEAFAHAGKRAQACATRNAERPTESRELAGGKTGPEYSVPSTVFSETLLKLGAELSKVMHDRPRYYGEEYQRAIIMLEAHKGETIELDEEEFQQLMEDRWDWRRDWFRAVTSVGEHALRYLGDMPSGSGWAAGPTDLRKDLTDNTLKKPLPSEREFPDHKPLPSEREFPDHVPGPD